MRPVTLPIEWLNRKHPYKANNDRNIGAGRALRACKGCREWRWERRLLDPDATPRAVDATHVVAKVQRHAGDVEMAPPTTMLPVVAGASLPAPGAAALPPRRRHVDHETLIAELHIEHTDPFQTQQGTELRCDAHSTPLVSRLA